MQNEFFNQSTFHHLRIVAVLLPILASNAHDEWNGTTVPDTRLMQSREAETEIGQWFATQAGSYRVIAWDDVPAPLVGSGGTI